MKRQINQLLTVCGCALLLTGSGVSTLGQLTATHQTGAGYTPGATFAVTNIFTYTNTLLSFLWRPHLPNGWTISSVSGTGSPELQYGDIVWIGTMPASPIQMVYVVQVPSGASGPYNLRGEVEYQLPGMVNPATLYATPDPLTVNGGTVLWTLTVDSANPASGVSITVSPRDNSGNTNGVTEFTRQYTNQALVTLSAPATASGNSFQRWLQDGALATTNLTTTVLMTTNHVLQAVYAGALAAQHSCSGTYTGGQFGVTNTCTYSGVVLSLLWRPHLPTGWTIGSVSGAGSPELQYGDIVWTGTMPASPIQMVYMVQVPAGASNTCTLRGEVEYQLSGMLNPATLYASPDPLTVSNVPPMARTLTVTSLSPSSGVSITASPPDNSGNTNGVTKFSRQYPNGAVVTLTAPATAGGNAFRRWEQDTVSVTTNLTMTATMATNHVVAAVYAPVAPIIVTQPQSQSVSAGTTVVFSVLAAGTAPLAYQWRLNGNNLSNGARISGTGTNSMTITPVQTTDAGSYTVVVTNAAGSITSQVAALTVIPIVSFHKTNRITINDYTSATPYPSTITVSAQVGTVKKATVTLHGLTHTWPDDVGALLVGPQGQKIALMSDAGGSQPIAGVGLTFDDDAAAGLPDDDPIVGGTWKPGPSGNIGTFVPPAPAGPYATALSVFQGADPNGSWSLYVEDFAPGDIGTITGGWTLTLVLEPPPVCPYFVPGTLQCLPGGQFQLQFAGTAGSNYEIQASSDLKNWKLLKTFCLSNSTCWFLDTNTNVVRRFYRAKLLPP